MPNEIVFTTGQGIRTDAGAYYRIVQLLGRGKNASAYLVLATSDERRGTFHTLKILQDATNSVKVQAFVQERDFLLSLEHPSIMRITDQGEFHSAGHVRPFYVCDYYTATLEDVIRTGNCTLARKLCYAMQLSSSLAYLAKQDPAIIHCDIKPANIFVDGLTCVLADFGLMRAHGVSDVMDLGPSLHTYRSPDIVECLNTQVPLSAKSDVFQLGLTLAELFTGQNPCRTAQSGSEPVELRDLVPVSGEFGQRITDLIQWMLALGTYQRISAAYAIDIWQGILFDAVRVLQRVDARVL